MQAATITSKRSDAIITNNYCVFHYMDCMLQVSISILILPLESLIELFTSVLFDVLEVNRESLIVLQPTILNKESYT